MEEAVRPPTLLTFVAGAAAGAGWMYLLDPVHGQQRRRDARREAGRRARAGALDLAADARRRAEEAARAAVDGYQAGRSGEPVVVEPPRSVWRRLAG
jgi:hypothetical protein